MDDAGRIIQFGGADLAEAMYLIGQAWIKVRSDPAGADEDLDAALKLIPRDTIEAITRLIDAGTLPDPGRGPEVTGAWLEQCRLAGAGEWTLTRIAQPTARADRQQQGDTLLGRLAAVGTEAQAKVESEADFLVRLRQIRLDAEAEMKAEMEARKNAG